MAIKLKLDGFDELLKKIEEAGGSIDAATRQCMKNSADIMQSELKSKMTSAKVDSDLISAMPPPEIQSSGNVITARVGYTKGAYNPDALSDGYKVVFLNYGTPHRSVHGKVVARAFIQKAKKAAKKPIKAEQEKTLTEIMKGLSK